MVINVFVLLYILSDNSKCNLSISITAINNAMVINKKASKM